MAQKIVPVARKENENGLTWQEWLHAAGRNYYQYRWYLAWEQGEDPTEYR